MNEELIREIDDWLGASLHPIDRKRIERCRTALAAPSAPSQGEHRRLFPDCPVCAQAAPPLSQVELDRACLAGFIASRGPKYAQPSPQTPAETEDVAQKIARSLEFEPPSLTVGIWRDYAKEAVAIIERQQARIADYQQQLRGILRRLESVCAEVDVFNAYEARDMVRDLIDGAQPPSAPAERFRCPECRSTAITNTADGQLNCDNCKRRWTLSAPAEKERGNG